MLIGGLGILYYGMIVGIHPFLKDVKINNDPFNESDIKIAIDKYVDCLEDRKHKDPIGNIGKKMSKKTEKFLQLKLIKHPA